MTRQLNIRISQILAEHFRESVGHMGDEVLIVGNLDDIPCNVSLVSGRSIHERHGKVGSGYFPVLSIGKVDEIIGNLKEGGRIELTRLIFLFAFMPSHVRPLRLSASMDERHL